MDATVDRTYVSRLERGLENPTVATLERLAIALDAKLASAWINLGNARARDKKFAEARAAYDKARAIDPEDPRVTAVMKELDELEAVVGAAGTSAEPDRDASFHELGDVLPALAALRVIRSDDGPQLFARVLENAAYLRDGLAGLGFQVVHDHLGITTPIVPVVVGVYWPRGTKGGAAAAMLGGVVTCFAWELLGPATIDPVLPGLVVSAVLYFSVSALTSAVE